MIGGRLGGLAAFLLQLRHNEAKLQAAARARALEEAERAAEAMRAVVPVEEGAARESIRAEPTAKGARVVVGGEGTTKDGYDYVRALEYGRPPSKSGPGQRATRVFTRTFEETRREGGARMAAGVAEDMKG